MITGGCECGAVRFDLATVRPEVSACHCSQCRRTSGHLWASTVARSEDLQFRTDDGLTWFASSNQARRGFCNRCGSSLFYVLNDAPEKIAVAAGCIDPPTGLRLTKHIFAADKGDYYDIADGLEILETW